MALSADTVPHFTTIAAFVSSLSAEITTIFRNVLLVCDEAGLIGVNAQWRMYCLVHNLRRSSATDGWTSGCDQRKGEQHDLRSAGSIASVESIKFEHQNRSFRPDAGAADVGLQPR
jgi:hypothetical protein